MPRLPALRRLSFTSTICLVVALSTALTVASVASAGSGPRKTSKRASGKRCATSAAVPRAKRDRHLSAKAAKARARAQRRAAKRRAAACRRAKRLPGQSRTTPITPSAAAAPAPPSAAASPSRHVAPVAAVTATTQVAAPSAATVVPPATQWSPNYDLGLTSWQAVQQPAGTQRLTTTTAPGLAGARYRPSGNVMRAELRAGDLTNTGGYIASRAEVYARAARPLPAPAEAWPDPVGSERWYAFDLFVPVDYPAATDTKWTTITQWKGHYGGSPPLALEIKRSNLRLGGTRGYTVAAGDLGPIEKGQWTRLVVGMKLSPDPATGWVEVYRDGLPKVARTSLSTMDMTSTGPDPLYLKQGLYRSTQWTATQVLYFSPVKIYAGGAGLDPALLG